MADHTPTPQELAALELYHQLVNLSDDHDPDGDALMVTLRMPNGHYVGDVRLSLPDVEALADGMIALQAAAAYEGTAAPLPVDNGEVTEADVNDVLTGFHSLLNPEGGDH